MIRAITLAICIALLTGCGPTVVAPSKPDAIDVHVPPECIAACTCEAAAPVVTTDPYSAMDAARYEHDKGKLCLRLCDTRRQGCVNAIERARAAGVIK